MSALTTTQQDYKKAKEACDRDIDRLLGYASKAGYQRTERAIPIAINYHRGLRADGITPEIHHPIKVSLSIYDDRRRIQYAGLDVDVEIAGGALHDTIEDYPKSLPKIKKEFNRDEFDLALVEICQRLDKNNAINSSYEPKHNLSLSEVFLNSTLDQYRSHNWDLGVLGKILHHFCIVLDKPETAVIKAHDRRDNAHTVLWLAPEKQPLYVVETRMLSNAIRKIIELKLYPKLEGLLNHSCRQMKNAIDSHVGKIQDTADDMYAEYGKLIRLGKTGDVVVVFADSGLIKVPNAPPPSSWSGQLQRPTGP